MRHLKEDAVSLRAAHNSHLRNQLRQGKDKLVPGLGFFRPPPPRRGGPQSPRFSEAPRTLAALRFFFPFLPVAAAASATASSPFHSSDDFHSPGVSDKLHPAAACQLYQHFLHFLPSVLAPACDCRLTLQGQPCTNLQDLLLETCRGHSPFWAQ